VAFELFGNSYIVAGDYKAVRMRPGMFGDGKWHLYDIVKDPGETTPLESQQPERFKKMLDIYKGYAKELCGREHRLLTNRQHGLHLVIYSLGWAGASLLSQRSA
jgi:hypothetical protein